MYPLVLRVALNRDYIQGVLQSPLRTVSIRGNIPKNHQVNESPSDPHNCATGLRVKPRLAEKPHSPNVNKMAPARGSLLLRVARKPGKK